MILKTFSILDSKAETFLPPFFCPTAAVALRNFEQAANDEGHAFNRHAADYTLFELGDFDDQHGMLIPHAAIINLGCAINLLRPSTGGAADPVTQGKITNIK